MRRPAMAWRVSMESWSTDHPAHIEEITMLKKTIAALGLAVAAASAGILAQPAYANGPATTTGAHGSIVSLGAFPSPLMVTYPMSDGSPSGGAGRR
ncbi:hypothetical protein NE236_40835 [Actinoallomurus purpureus]|uniref:hypothetical protein n=1 Tax=Actinoallomurus purpureus TaxID=478114 RepID=UPI00209205A4|nr:hypothetical protein [Actinoallomurus purpureus]MCO6011315.1 hypothetical protein [Actinoallomurus purpureus]